MNIHDYIFINLKVLSFVGLYPINLVKYVICLSCMFLLIIPQMVMIFKNWQNLSLILEVSSVLLTILLAVMKSLLWIYNRNIVEPFISFMITNYWQIVSRPEFFNIVHAYAKLAQNITKGYLFLLYNALLFFYSLPIIEQYIDLFFNKLQNDTIHFPFVAEYPEWYYVSPLYEIVYASQVLATSVCASIVLATDTFMATAIFHTCGHFKVLQTKLQNLESDSVKQHYGAIEIKISESKKRLIHIVKHHQIVLWFCDKMERIFSPLMFFQTLTSSLIICLVGLQVSNTFMQQYKMIQYISYLMMALSQFLLLSFPSDDLIYQSFMVSKAVWAMKWYESSDLTIKHDVCMIMIRSQKPSCITAGKFYKMHLENFSSVLSTSLSYFMVLRSFNPEYKLIETE